MISSLKKLLFFTFFICLTVEIISFQNSYILRESEKAINVSNIYSPGKIFSKNILKLGNYFVILGKSANIPTAVSANYIENKNKEEKEVVLSSQNEQTAQPEENIIEKTIASASGNINLTNEISIKNQTSYSVDINALNEKGTPFKMSADSSKPEILIIHTHGTETYTPSEEFKFTPTSSFRTTDNNYNVVRVGFELANHLRENGINVIHDTTLYDYPEYNSSYDKAYYSIQALTTKYPSISIVIDLHRDAINTDSGETIKLVGEIEGEKAAQMMFVVGTDECGFSHPNWEFNLKFAAMIQENLLKESPSLVRPINLRTSRFNQHFTKGSLIVEVGTNGNTLDEALLSSKYLANALSKTINELKK